MLLFQPGFVIVLVAFKVHEVQLIHQSGFFEELEGPIDGDPIDPRVLVAGHCIELLGIEVISRTVDEIQQNLALARQSDSSLLQRILDTARRHVIFRAGTLARFSTYHRLAGARARQHWASPDVEQDLGESRIVGRIVDPDHEQVLAGCQFVEPELEALGKGIEYPVARGKRNPLRGVQRILRSDNSDAVSLASTITSTAAPANFGCERVTSGGVWSTSTGVLTNSCSRADAGGFARRSEALTRKKYFPSARTSGSSAYLVSSRSRLIAFHSVSPSPRKKSA